MKVTAIQQQQKRTSRYSIFIDGKYSLSLSDIGLLESKLMLNQELSAEQLRAIKQFAENDNFYDKVLNYIAIRPRSKWEVETYLKLKKCPPLLSVKLLNKLSKNDMINDRSFAKSWVESRRLLKPVSRRRLVYELRAKHVSSEDVEQAIGEDETTDLEVLKDLVTRKRQQLKYRDNLRLMQYLSRQGFNYRDIKEAMSDD